jgi:hypothetical protein
MAGIGEDCSTAYFVGDFPECYFACPMGDTDSFMESGFYIRFEMKNLLCEPYPTIPATDFWLIDCDPLRTLTLCIGSGSICADSATNSSGVTTMSLGSLAAGGCANKMSPVCHNVVLTDGYNVPLCWDVRVRSVDMNGDLVVTIADLSIFAVYYPPQTYNACADFDCNGAVTVSDLARLARHFGPPGHGCR